MALRLTRINPTKNMARWYEIDVQPTLFGEYVSPAPLPDQY